MVQNARITVFTVYELLSENRQGELKLCPLPSMTDIMAPFWPLMIPNTSYAWEEELDDVFTCSEVELIKDVSHKRPDVD